MGLVRADMWNNFLRKNVSIFGQRTSVRLEAEFWHALEEICRIEGFNIHDLCTWIESRRDGDNRTSSLRTFAIRYFKDASTAHGHDSAGHGTLLEASAPAAPAAE